MANFQLNHTYNFSYNGKMRNNVRVVELGKGWIRCEQEDGTFRTFSIDKIDA